ncbi:MAG TPA: hypothetical protein VFK96_03040 [Gammaproteobacteria bacterium]|nr:hypothetical protein [Gammaproteobacteria bacterium]
MKQLEDYADFIKETDFQLGQPYLPQELCMDDDGILSTFYAPFDHINEHAEIVICGITPGLQQALLALREASKQLRSGASVDVAREAAKNTGSFGGPMRRNLVRMLDFIGLHKKLGMPSCSELFGINNRLVHYTSALRYPVFRHGKNYSGVPDMTGCPALRQQLDQNLSTEITVLSNDAIYIPLGPKVEAALKYMADKGAVHPSKILCGMPHPSGANAERIAFFLNEKAESDLSAKTNARRLSENREKIMSLVSAL